MMVFGRRWTNTLPPLAMLAFTAGFLVMTYHLPARARAVPLIVGWAALVLSSVDLATRTGGEFGHALMRALNPAGLRIAAEEAVERPKGSGPLLSGVGLVVLLVAAFILAGVLVAAPLMIFTALTIAYRREPISNVVTAAAVTAAIYLLFSVLLRLHLYPGVLFGGTT